MTQVTHSYPAPVQGVSTLSPRNRAEGQAGKQLNLRSDPVEKLARRPAADWKQVLVANAAVGDHAIHEYRRDGKDFLILIKTDGTVTAFVDGVSKTVTGNLTGYMGTVAQTRLNNINDTTFVLNTSKIVAMTAATDASVVEGVSHINVKSAMNYGETVKINYTKYGGGTGSVSYTTPTLGDPPAYDAADTARASAKVAEELATLLTAEAGITAIAKSSTVAVWEAAYPREFLQIEVESGQGDRTCVAINSVQQDTDGFPLYAVHGTIVSIRPDPTSDSGKYYLIASAIDPDVVLAPTEAQRVLSEVTWVETRSPDEPYEIDETTMPHTILYNRATDDFTVGPPAIGWNDRMTGDNNTIRLPTFIGSTIDNMSYMQKRLIFLSENSAVMTRTDDIYDFWRASANTLLTSDPIDIASSAPATDSLQHLIQHNKSLLVFASNAQFKISGDTAITPETVAMPQTTSFDCQTGVPPVSMGNSIFFPTTYGESSGIHEYTAEANTTQDNGFPITHHVVGYLPGEVTQLVSSPNLEMMAVTTDGAAGNELFIYEQFTSGDSKSQMSWSKWTLPTNNNIVKIYFSKAALNVLVIENSKLIHKKFQMYSSVNTVKRETIFLDDRIEVTSTDNLTITLPTDYPDTADILVIGTMNTTYPLFQIPYTRVGQVITFDDGDISVAGQGNPKVFVGVPFRSEYTPTRPYVYNDGVPDTADTLRINSFVLSVVDTSEITMSTATDYSNPVDYRHTARTLGTQSSALGSVPFESTDWKFPFRHRADLAVPTFFTESPYNMSIIGLRWVGQVHKNKQRI